MKVFNVGILVFYSVAVLDFTGPFEVQPIRWKNSNVMAFAPAKRPFCGWATV
jgi:hypothetical protein